MTLDGFEVETFRQRALQKYLTMGRSANYSRLTNATLVVDNWFELTDKSDSYPSMFKTGSDQVGAECG